MNYEKLYFAFIEKYKGQVFADGVYTELHHIKPHHAGGDDSKENLIRLSYRQHIFAHRLLWKAYNKIGDKIAWRMMSGQDVDVKISCLKAIGQANVDSGHLDRIRVLANTPAQRQHASNLIQARIKSGRHAEIIEMAKDAWRGSSHTDEWKAEKSIQMKEYRSTEVGYELMLKAVNLSVVKKKEDSHLLSQKVIQNAERNEEYLQKLSSKSRNKFISPEGFEFDSPIFAAAYYGNVVKPHVIENWCKRHQHGWSREAKAVQD